MYSILYNYKRIQKPSKTLCDSLSVTCGRSAVFSGCSSFLHE